MGVADHTRGIDAVLARLAWMEESHIWPEGLRYLWTDAFGLVLLVSLFRATAERRFLSRAEWLVADVERVLGRSRGLRIGEAEDRSGQYFHYLTKWIFALDRLGRVEPQFHERALALARDVHEAFVLPRRGVHWKMEEDLSAPMPGFGFGAIDPYDGLVIYRLLDEASLSAEIAAMRDLVEASYRRLVITQDLGLGMMLWLSHFFPDEAWARLQRARCLSMLDAMWIDSEGCFCRQPSAPGLRFAFTNYGIALGLQAVGAMPERVDRLRRYFAVHRSGDHYDTDAITHVMACCADFPGLFLRDESRARAGARDRERAEPPRRSTTDSS